jgi:hypothetical protein
MPAERREGADVAGQFCEKGSEEDVYDFTPKPAQDIGGFRPDGGIAWCCMGS